MKSLYKEIILKNLIILAIVVILIILIISYLVQKKAEMGLADTVQYILESKYKSLNKDNLETAFDYNNLNFTSFILNDAGKPIYGSQTNIDVEVVELCANNKVQTFNYEKSGVRKYIAIKKNNDLCLVVEGNTNTSILLGRFVQTVLIYSFVFLLLILILLLKISSRKIQKPIKNITANAEKALLGKFGEFVKTQTKIEEILNLDKYFNFVIDLMKQKMDSGLDVKNLKTKSLNNNFVKEKAMLEANKFKMAIDSAGEIIVLLDKKGYLTYLNRFAENYLGIKNEQAENKKIRELWHKADEENLWTTNLEKIISEKQNIVFTAKGKKSNGAEFESIVNLYPIINKDGQVENILMIERDKSEEIQKERLKSEFISVVSHELRTPMTVIRGYASLLEEEKLGELNAKQKDYLDKISEEIGKLLNLVNDMLDIQKFSAGKVVMNMEKTDMQSFLKDEINEFLPVFMKKNLFIKIQNEAKNIFASIDKRYFHRVISNLISNAYKFTESGGVTIFLLNPDEHNLVIAVKDTGVGINESAITHLFDKFYQASNVLNRKQEGTGLGLSIVKQVVESHHGIVWVESKEGEGSTFYIALATS